MNTKTLTSGAELARVSKFGVVGALNTAVDFVIYNVLSSKAGLTLIQSNLISTTIAMTFSFFANRHLVFPRGSKTLARQAVIFVATTAFGLYVLQTGTIKLLTDVWFMPFHVLLSTLHGLGMSSRHDAFVIKNGAKAMATVVSLSWNYLMYKKVVFK